MALTSIGDLARGFALRSRNADLARTLSRLGTELASGRSADPVARLEGNLSHFSQIEHDLVLASSYRSGASEAAISAAAMQTALARVGEVTDGLVTTLALATTTTGAIDIPVVTDSARAALESVVSALNTGASGRHLFSGTAVDSAPLVDVETILTNLAAALAWAASPGDALALADAFFDQPGGGFETLLYRGATDSLAPIRLGAGDSANLDLRADHPALRGTLKHMALAALAGDPALALDDAGRQAVFSASMDGLLTARGGQVALQADLGVAEERIERAGTRFEAEVATLEMARGVLLGVDPYETATEMEAVRQQIETLYAVTARMSRLSLMNFLS